VSMGDFAKCCDFIRVINRSGFSRLRKGKRRCDHLMRAMSAAARKCIFHTIGRKLAFFAGQAKQFDAAAKELWRAAFIGSCMGFGMTQNDAPGWCNVRKCQRICSCSSRHQEGRNVSLEYL